MTKKRSTTVRLRSNATGVAGTIRVSELEKKIRRLGTKKSQRFKSKKTYSRSVRKQEDRKLLKEP